MNKQKKIESKINPVVYLDNVFSHIDHLPRHGVDFLYETFAYEIPNSFFMAKGNWDGIKRLTKKYKNNPNRIQVLTGHLPKVLSELNFLFDIDIKDIKIVDERERPKKTLDLEWDENAFKLRPYQKKVIKNTLEKRRGIMCLATGAGKTILAAKLVHELGVSPFIFYVMTRELLYQSKAKLEAAMPDLEVGIVGDGNCEIKDVNVVTIQTVMSVLKKKKNMEKDMRKFADMEEGELAEIKKENMSHVTNVQNTKAIINMVEQCKAIYFDEVHHCPAQISKTVLQKSTKCFHFYGGSATPVRTDNADLMIEGLFGPKTCNINASFLIKKGFLMKPDIYYIKLKEKAQRVENYNDAIEKNIINNVERNDHIVAVAKTLEGMGLSTLILVTRIDHGKLLKSKIEGSEFISGSSSKKDRDDVLAKLNTKELKIVVSTTIADEGLDIPSLNCVIIAGGGKSPTKCKQRVGRAIRKTEDKKYSIIFDFVDVGKYLTGHSKARKKILEEEPEFNVKIIKSFGDKSASRYNYLF